MMYTFFVSYMYKECVHLLLMKKLILTSALLLSCLTNTAFGQSLSGKASYMAKSTVNLDFGNRQIPEDRKARMMKFMNDMSTNEFELVFNNNESLYSEVEELDQSSQMGSNHRVMMKAMFNQSSGEFYKNTEETTYINKRDIYGKPFSIVDSLEHLEWEVSDELKMIGQYTCFKATAKTKQFVMPEVPFGRSKEGEKRPEMEEMMQETEVTAWFTLDIPVNQGPDKYYGLPGLILEVQSPHLTILCTRVELDKDKAKDVDPPKGGKEVSQEEFDKIMKEKSEEVREQMRNRRRGRFGGGPH